MAKIMRFPESPGDRREKGEVQSKAMEDGRFYDLTPPSHIAGEIFDRVQCEYQVPNHLNEYVVRGIPRGGTKPKSYVLRFIPSRGVHVTESEKQEF